VLLEKYQLCEESGLSNLKPLQLSDFETNSWRTTGVPLAEYGRILILLKLYRDYHTKLGGDTEYLNKYIGQCEGILKIKKESTEKR